MDASIEASEIRIFAPRSIEARGKPSVFEQLRPSSRIRTLFPDFFQSITKAEFGKAFFDLNQLGQTIGRCSISSQCPRHACSSGIGRRFRSLSERTDARISRLPI